MPVLDRWVEASRRIRRREGRSDLEHINRRLIVVMTSSWALALSTVEGDAGPPPLLQTAVAKASLGTLIGRPEAALVHLTTGNWREAKKMHGVNPAFALVLLLLASAWEREQVREGAGSSMKGRHSAGR